MQDPNVESGVDRAQALAELAGGAAAGGVAVEGDDDGVAVRMLDDPCGRAFGGAAGGRRGRDERGGAVAGLRGGEPVEDTFGHDEWAVVRATAREGDGGERAVSGRGVRVLRWCVGLEVADLDVGEFADLVE